jgi:YidC/Oxa1 family membrane protein insertase
MILAVALSIAILLGYQYFMPSPPPAPPPAAKDNTAALSPAGKAPAAKPLVQPAAAGGVAAAGGLIPGVAAAARAIEVKTPLYTARISTAGGGIDSFLLNDYKDVSGPGGKRLDIVGSKTLSPLPL